MSTETERCTCGETACESELCDCDAIRCPVNHRAERAEAELERLRTELDAATEVYDEACGELSRARTELAQLDVWLAAAQRKCEMAEQAATRWHDDYGRIEAERDALKAAIRAVTSDWATRARSAATWVDEAKTDVEKVRWNVWRTAYECLASELLAALDTPTPTEGETP